MMDFDIKPLEWETEYLLGVEILVGTGLGLRYMVAPMVDKSGWIWSFNDQSSPKVPTEEAAKEACNADFKARVLNYIRPAGRN
jgi:hypothetical protein